MMAKKSIKKNTAFNALKTVSSIVFPLITFPYISRVLLPENVGKISFGLSIVSYFTLIASLGITTYAIRECSAVRDDKAQLGKTASQIFSINIITTVIAYIVLAITLLCYRKLENYRSLIIIQSLSIIATTLGADWLNSAMEDFKYITLRTVAFQFISLALTFIFVRKPEDYMKYAVISLVSSAGANIVNIWYRRRYCKVSFTKNLEWKKHITPIMLLFVMILAQTIFNNLDITMLGLFTGDREVGLYSTAHKIMNLINQVVASLCWVILPRMSLYFEAHDYNEINKLLKKVLSYNLTVGLPCVVGTVMLSKDIILAIAGPHYVDAAIVLQVLMIAFVFMLIGGNFLGNAVLLPARKEKYYMVACIIATAINIVANLIFIPLLGATGAATTTAFSELVLFVILLYKKDKQIKIRNLFRVLLSPIIGCLAIIAICLSFSYIQNLWLRLILSTLIGGGLYFVIQVLTKNELIYDVLTGINKITMKKNNMEGQKND